MARSSDLPEFCRLVDTSRLPRGDAVHDIAATPAEREALARRFGLMALDSLEARVRLRRIAGGYVRLSAEFAAAVVQSCVVTLEPVSSCITEDFTLLYGEAEEQGDVVLDSEAETLEPLGDGTIDIGEAVAQQLSLALDPYPRAPGAAGEADSASSAENRPESPFAALARRAGEGRSSG
jgi:uncharacterized metal-binding protein YceD (DUF177 family)